MGEYRYTPTLSLTAALDGVGGQHQAQAVLAPQTWHTFYRRLGGPQGRSGQGAENLASNRDSIPGPSSP